MTDTTILKTVFLAASPETVWAYLTEKDKLGQWFHPARENLAAGQDFALMESGEDGQESKVCWGTVEHMEPPFKLVYSFTIKPLNGVMTTVTWTLEDVHGSTRLTLLQEGLGVAGAAAMGLIGALDAGWDRHLGGLRAALK